MKKFCFFTLNMMMCFLIIPFSSVYAIEGEQEAPRYAFVLTRSSPEERLQLVNEADLPPDYDGLHSAGKVFGMFSAQSVVGILNEPSFLPDENTQETLSEVTNCLGRMSQFSGWSEKDLQKCLFPIPGAYLLAKVTGGTVESLDLHLAPIHEYRSIPFAIPLSVPLHNNEIIAALSEAAAAAPARGDPDSLGLRIATYPITREIQDTLTQCGCNFSPETPCSWPLLLPLEGVILLDQESNQPDSITWHRLTEGDGATFLNWYGPASLSQLGTGEPIIHALLEAFNQRRIFFIDSQIPGRILMPSFGEQYFTDDWLRKSLCLHVEKNFEGREILYDQRDGGYPLVPVSLESILNSPLHPKATGLFLGHSHLFEDYANLPDFMRTLVPQIEALKKTQPLPQSNPQVEPAQPEEINLAAAGNS